jgi:protein-S-isoprenylcysteine O-methyltransferase Ste14
MSQPDFADVAVKPPLLFLGAVAAGLLLSLALPIGPDLGSANELAVTVGLILVALGFALAAFSVRTFSRAGADVVPGHPATTLVTNGPYRVTRNPIYIGFTLLYFGIAILATSVWMLFLLVPLLIILQRGVVKREESYLNAKFGEAYDKYKVRVPRWL